VNKEDPASPVDPSETEPSDDAAAEQDAQRAAEIASLVEARYRKRVSDLFGRLRTAVPGIPATVKNNDRALAEYLASLTSGNGAGVDDPDESDDDEPTNDRKPQPKHISYQRHKEALARAGQQVEGKYGERLKALEAENATLRERNRRDVAEVEVRRLCELPEIDLAADGVIRYLRTPDSDFPFELRPGEKSGVVVWDTSTDEEAFDAGRPLTVRALLAGLRKREELSYLRQGRVATGGDAGGGTNGARAAKRPRLNDDWTKEDTSRLVTAGLAEMAKR